MQGRGFRLRVRRDVIPWALRARGIFLGGLGGGVGWRRARFVVRRGGLGMTLCGEQHRRWKRRVGDDRRNAGDAENRVQQGAIFCAQARDFVLLRGDRSALLRDFEFEGACVARARDAAPDLTKRLQHGFPKAFL